jgi:hypothetical protein
MSVRKEDLQRWVADKPEKPFLIVVCDTFDFDNYAVHCTLETLPDEYDRLNGKNMQRIVGVYIKDGVQHCHRDGTPVR